MSHGPSDGEAVKNSKFSQFAIKSEKTVRGEQRVVKVEAAGAPVIHEFSLQTIQEPGTGTYQDTKRRFGSLAATDTDRAARTRKDSRFSINPLLRDPLAVEEEERRVIEEKVRGRVEAMSEEVRERAFAAGQEQGLKAGHEEAFRAFRGEASERIRQFDELLNEMDEAKAKIFAENERFLIEMVYRLARSVTLRELTTDREYVLRLARELIEGTGVRENIKVKIHPNDMATAAMLKESLESSLGGLKNLTVEASPNVRGGGCIVETEWNAIDASIETQLEGIKQALLPKEST